MIRRKIFGGFLALIIAFYSLPMLMASAATDPKYVGGLLDGATFQIGTTVGGTPTTNTTSWTDNDSTTGIILDNGKAAWYTFASPQSFRYIASSYITSASYSAPTFTFYDLSGTPLGTYKPNVNQVEILPQEFNNVTTVAITPSGSYSTLLYEADIFQTPTAAPEPLNFSWTQASDSTVDLFWNKTGADSYVILRADSATGIYSPLVEIPNNFQAEQSYTDTTVVNGHTYYYSIASKNPAGVSTNSTGIGLTPNKTKYTGGLLDRVPLTIGANINDSSGGTTRYFTDNIDTKLAYLDSTVAYYKFATPQSINSVILAYYSGSKLTMEFYDSNNDLIDMPYTPIASGNVEMLPHVYTNVATVALKAGASSTKLYEWNVFATPSAPPAIPTISWSQAHDQSVDLFWGNVGAQSYTVERSTNGVNYTAIASNITDILYSDTSVTNGTAYSYRIISVNSAGESVPSTAVTLTPKKTKYTGGLLDRLPLTIGTSINDNTGNVTRELTDNTDSRIFYINNNVAYYKFVTPQSINSVVLAYPSGNRLTMEFYDSNNNLIDTAYTPIASGNVEMLPHEYTNVSTVVLRGGSSTTKVSEWNVFSMPSAPPAIPTINWSQGHDQTIDLFWNNDGAKSYIVERSIDGTGYTVIASNVTDLFYTDTNVTNGTTYYYRVSAVNPAGVSAPSNVVTVTPNQSKYTNGLLDRKPLGYGTVITNTPGTIVRHATDNNGTTKYNTSSGNLLYYVFSTPKDINSMIVKYSSSDPVVNFYDKDNNLLKSITLTSVTNDVTVPFDSVLENVVTVTLRSSSSYTYVNEWNLFGEDHPTAPAAPTNLTAVAGDQKVSLSWDAVGNATGGYIVKRSTTAGNNYTNLGTVAAGATSYVDTSVTNGTTYYYVIQAVNAIGPSSYSNEASAQPNSAIPGNPTAPTNLTATPGNASITLRWDPVPGAVGYSISRTTDLSKGFTFLTNVGPTPTSYTDTNVTNGTTYYYVVQAYFGGEDYSTNSNTASATPNSGGNGDGDGDGDGDGGTGTPPGGSSGDRALLEIMLNTGEIKEYDVPMSVVNSFITWYENRSVGQGPVTFALDRSNNNLGPFANRKDYIIFDKIIMFEVNAYNSN